MDEVATIFLVAIVMLAVVKMHEPGWAWEGWYCLLSALIAPCDI